MSLSSRTTTWARTEATCGACAATVPGGAVACPQCGQSTGPFTPVVVTANVLEDTNGGSLQGPSGNRRHLTGEQTRWLTRRLGTGGRA